MSSRAFKKIYAKQLKEQVERKIQENENVEEEEEPYDSVSAQNAFSLLQETNQEEDETKDDETNNFTETVSTPVTSGKKKKKTKPTKVIKSKEAKKEEEDIDQIIQQFSTQHVQEVQTPSNKEVTKPKSVFQLDVKSLNLQNEIVKLFGKQTIKKETNLPKRLQYHQKKTLLVKPKLTWPRVVSGISMELDGTRNGINYFRYVWSSSYQKLQHQFYMCVQTNDPGTFQYLLHEHPYHCDSLLQLSEVCKQTGELDTAFDLIERSIYYLECSWHHLFNPLLGDCRLEYKVDENRTLFLALFRYIQLMGRKGYSHTAMEYCKLLLSLDPSDPLNVVFMIDFYCLRSGQYEYLVELYFSEEMKENNLATLPNMVFGVALAKFHMECSNDHHARSRPAADELLQYALMLFPMMLGPLVKKCKLSLVDGEGRDLSSHGFFASAHTPQSLTNLINLYLERNYTLWQSQQETLPWLLANVLAVTKKAEMQDPMIDNCTAVLHEEYVKSPKTYYNHLLVSGALPADVLNAVRREGGVRLYNNFHEAQAQAQPVVHANTSNPFALFLSSLFYTPNAPYVGPTEGGQAAGWYNTLLNFLNTQQETNDDDQEQ